MDLTLLTVMGLAAMRIAQLLVRDTFGPIADLRTKIISHGGPLATLFTCIRCMSVWSGLLVTVVWVLLPAPVVLGALLPFALSQVAIMIVRFE